MWEGIAIADVPHEVIIGESYLMSICKHLLTDLCFVVCGGIVVRAGYLDECRVFLQRTYSLMHAMQ